MTNFMVRNAHSTDEVNPYNELLAVRAHGINKSLKAFVFFIGQLAFSLSCPCGVIYLPMIRSGLVALFLLFAIYGLWAQEGDRQLLRGKVLYRNSNVPNENVVNTTSEKATITNEDGEFGIWAKAGDELVFMAVNYEMERLIVTPEIMAKNRLVVEVNEKVTQLDEVVVGPENQKAFLEVKNEEFKQFEYETDRTTAVENIALSQTERGMENGLNIKNIFKALVGLGKNKEDGNAQALKMSDVLRQLYDDRFFTKDLSIPQDKIDDFLYYCDTQMPEKSLLQKQNEFELIDFLVNQSKAYLTQLDAKN